MSDGHFCHQKLNGDKILRNELENIPTNATLLQKKFQLRNTNGLLYISPQSHFCPSDIKMCYRAVFVVKFLGFQGVDIRTWLDSYVIKRENTKFEWPYLRYQANVWNWEFKMSVRHKNFRFAWNKFFLA